MALTEAPAGLADEEALRADLYDLLGTLLARPPSADLLARVAGLGRGVTHEGAHRGAHEGAHGGTHEGAHGGAHRGADGALARPVSALAGLAREMTAQAVRTEYDALFIGLVRGELLPYASYYLTGFLNEKPLAVLRRDMRRLGIMRAPQVSEPEDHIASLCEMMAGLIRGRFGAPAGLSVQAGFFAAHLAPWAGHFFGDLQAAKAAAFYAPVGAIGGAFVEIERQAFAMGA
jgi:TorA maturation chaperone TorD